MHSVVLFIKLLFIFNAEVAMKPFTSKNINQFCIADGVDLASRVS